MSLITTSLATLRNTCIELDVQEGLVNLEYPYLSLQGVIGDRLRNLLLYWKKQNRRFQ
uniref:Uncharacterized protein n=1 Tax=Ciona intestinalis TaxID=7719 RepID=H2XN01_CIOIN